MRLLGIFLLFLFVNPSYADSYLCISEAASGVSHGEAGIHAQIYSDASSKKFIQTNEGGSWIVKEHGKEAVMFNSCKTEALCESTPYYSGAFIRDSENYFTVFSFMLSGENENVALVFKGRCSKL